MFLAPLNNSRFFRKVFSRKHIAKQFIEDFLDLTISDIKQLKDKNRLTDKSIRVELDFECTIGNAVVIVDMQQWFKTDRVQRFYTYHTVDTELHLDSHREERIPDKKLLAEIKEEYTKGKEYKDLKPVLTLIWMVDDTLRFTDNFVGYMMTPEIETDFILKMQLWMNQEILNLLAERKKVANNIDFLPENRLVFLFEPNIVKDTTPQKYQRWFRFAEKTKDKNNDESDFEEFRDDPVFREIMCLISGETLTKRNLSFIKKEEENREMFQRFLQGEYEMGKKDGKKFGLEKSKKMRMEKGEQIGMEKGEQIGVEKEEQERNRETVILMIKDQPTA